jgi:hypothetical protein
MVGKRRQFVVDSACSPVHPSLHFIVAPIRKETEMPYTDEKRGKNCFRCIHLSASDEGYVCGMGFGEARTIWTGDLALICPLFEERAEPTFAAPPAADANI